MPRIPILKLRSREKPGPPENLASYQPVVAFEGILFGVDNLRHDVVFDSKFTEGIRTHLLKLAARHGGVEAVLDPQELRPTDRSRQDFFLGRTAPTQSAPSAAKPAPGDLKNLLAEMQLGILNKARVAGNIYVDLLGRIACIKFLRTETAAQYAEVLERCRIRQKSFDGIREQQGLDFRQKVAWFQVNKKLVLRKITQELFQLLREIEKETLARTRRSIYGDSEPAGYDLLLNPLIFTEDGRDDAINAEQYVLWGNFERDRDRFCAVRNTVLEFLRSLGGQFSSASESTLDGWLNVPENGRVIVGSGANEDSRAARAEKLRLQIWVELLEQHELTEHVLAAYEVVPLLPEFGDLVNAQQLKNALISDPELFRVETMVKEGARRPVDKLLAAVDRTRSYSAPDCSRIAARFLFDFMRYHRDWRKLEALNAAVDAVHLVQHERKRELSALNGLLYEFSSKTGGAASSEAIARHVVIKADVRDSSRLTRSMVKMGLNPASFFSLNFYEPVNKVLERYGATKVFLEGDAIILSLLEKGDEQGCLVARACALAKEILDIVGGYNERLESSGLPSLELGLGISYQDSAPMFLMDGDRPIMISDALNESDRLSSSSKSMRHFLNGAETPFRVYAFEQAGARTDGDSYWQVNVGGIRLSEAAFLKLQEEISLQHCNRDLEFVPQGEQSELYRGLVAVDREVFRQLLVRKARLAILQTDQPEPVGWSSKSYYEVCTDTSLYAALFSERAAAASK